MATSFAVPGPGPHTVTFPGTGLNPRQLDDYDRACIDLYAASKPEQRVRIESQIASRYGSGPRDMSAVDNAWSGARNLVERCIIVAD